MEPFSQIPISQPLETVTTNDTLVESPRDLVPAWEIVFEKVQLVVAILGAFMNIFTFATFFLTHSVSKLMSLLLKHQALLDFSVCLLGAVILVQPWMWTVGVHVIDIVVCHVWHSQQIYWLAFFLSTWNLVLLAIERFLAVCKPFHHMKMTRSRMILYIVIIYIINGIIVIPMGFLLQLNNGQCRINSGQGSFEPLVSNFFYFYGLFGFLSTYIAPCIFFFVLYGKTIMTLRKRQANDNNLGQSNVINLATTQLTKSAVVVTIVYIIANGPNAWSYMLASVTGSEFIMHSPVQKVTVFLTLLNSCANPVVYLTLLPSYRRQVMKLFTRTRSENQ